MTRTVYSDFDDFCDAIRGITGRFIPTARSASCWWIEAVDVGRICVQQLQIGGPSTFAGDGEPNTLTLGVPVTDPSQMRIDGQVFDPEAFLLFRHDRPFTLTHVDVCRWTFVTFPCNLIGSFVVDAHICRRVRKGYLSKVRHQLLRALAVNDWLQANSVARAAVEKNLFRVLARTLEESETSSSDRHWGRPQLSRAKVVARTLALLEEKEGQPLMIDDLCRATQVSERTLRAIFHEFFGVGPIRLLKVRQLREIRDALLRADAQTDTVTRIASRFGIWDFSQFARNYKALFGESPSRTLRASPVGHRRRSSISWLQCASRIFIDDFVPLSGSSSIEPDVVG